VINFFKKGAWMTVNQNDCQELVKNHINAWNTWDPEKVASTYAPDAIFIINRGDPMNGRADISEMAAGFMAEFPDMRLTCDTVQLADGHMVYTWTFEGHHIETKNLARFKGWEEWDLDENLQVTKSLGWYDAQEYERQVVEGV
jgi:uncharacterized protein (TIGR02246 family)